MFISKEKIVFALSASFSFIAAGLIPVNSNIQLHNAPGVSSEDTLHQVYRSLSSIVVSRDTKQDLKTSIVLDSNLEGIVLFEGAVEIPLGSSNATLNGGIEIVCATCYIKGTATAELNIKGNFSKAWEDVKSQATKGIGNFTEAVINYADNITDNLTKIALNVSNYDFPVLNANVNIDVPVIPETDLILRFDEMELYMQIDTTISAGLTYIMNLFTSQTAVGIEVGDLLVGIVFSVDLILDVTGEVDISSGFHIQLEDGVGVKIPMFGKDVRDFTYNGGKFEFLDVTVKSGAVILTGTLRIGLTAGIAIATPDFADAFKAVNILTPWAIEAAIDASVWIDIASFETSITAASATEGNDCNLKVIEEYSMGIGAGAGATLQIGDHFWGPEPEILIPLYFTTLADKCIKKAATAPPVSSTATVEATTCVSTGYPNCPASLQKVTSNTVTKTVTAIVTPGLDPKSVTVNTVVNAIPFTTEHRMPSLTGSPVSYVPKATVGPSEVPIVTGILEESTGGVSNKIIIGVSVGVGVPVLLLLIAGFVYCCRRKRRAGIKMTEPEYPATVAPAPETASLWTNVADKKSPDVNVVEIKR
ncbi:hypothetical protein VTL71DRAFT_5953 [Oculimacula yallundae]|uniref:Mid2 domain-containing protein n=1 Tax=Oculimacula yallundae TaxID=86028 RepID=A0ABR4C0G9_9HELO